MKVNRILAVDDDDLIRLLIAQVLTQSGYKVDAFKNEAAAWEALQTNHYDLLITDDSMRNVSGVELLKQLDQARITLPVIMVSRTLPQKGFVRPASMGSTATLLKPYTVKDLLSMVKNILREAEESTGAAPAFRDKNIKPDQIEQTEAPVRAATPVPANCSHRILVADEDRDLRSLYAEALARPGYQIDFVEDGAAAWEALQVRNYHLLITEHEMPKLNGLELVRKLRAAHMDLPVVMAAGRLPVHELAQPPSLQFAATLIKPFALDALLDTVENVLHAKDDLSGQISEKPSFVIGWDL